MHLFRNIFFSLALIAASSCKPVHKDQGASVEQGFILATKNLPGYEQNLNHAQYVSKWTKEFSHKGLVTYRTVCFNCHGNPDQPGSIPTSSQFWTDSLKYGSDPYSMYQTLTRGVGLMAPQVQLTPQEKYEVIHFIREEFIKEQNPDQYYEVTEEYLESLPIGDSLGPEPKTHKPWAEMDYGNWLIQTYEFSEDDDPPRVISGGRSPLANEDYRDLNFAYKGIAIRLDPGEGGIAAGHAFALFDHDLMRLVGFWTGEGFIDYRSILLNDEHNIFPRTVGTIDVENPVLPGWAHPETGTFEDPRFVAIDGRPFGPLPREWAHYIGLYHHEGKVIIKYRVGDAEVLESFQLERLKPSPVFSRTIDVTPSPHELKMVVANDEIEFGSSGVGAQITKEDPFWSLIIPANTNVNFKLTYHSKNRSTHDVFTVSGPEKLRSYTTGGAGVDVARVVEIPIIKGDDSEAYAVDVFMLPQPNPWKSRMRPTGIDFLQGGDQAVVCTIDGEVWRLEGISQDEGTIKWYRIATGLFQPLGIKVMDGNIYVGCRDQIVLLKDLNGDGETDFYESFNSDHQVTEHFHEFAMGLQVDGEGHFYYAKSGRHARRSLVPQHGTLIKVSPDGRNSEILANGFRAANGVCLNQDGSFYVTDQEGYWNPMNRINLVTKGGFYGNMYGYDPPTDSSDQAMIQPLMWVDMKYDRSPAELLWADSEDWGPLNGALLNLSYGYGKIFIVYPQTVGSLNQGAMLELQIPQFPTGIMRGRFNPKDGQLYACGMSAWATNQMIQVGGLYRIRYTGLPANTVVDFKAITTGLRLTFSDPLDPLEVVDVSNYTINTWDLKRTRNYGSKRYNEKTITIDQAILSEDKKTVTLLVPEIKKTWVMEVLYSLESLKGESVKGAIQNTIYALEQDNNM